MAQELGQILQSPPPVWVMFVLAQACASPSKNEKTKPQQIKSGRACLHSYVWDDLIVPETLRVVATLYKWVTPHVLV